MTDLLTRLEQATEGSEEIDVAIGREWYGYGPEDPLWHMMPFSRSLDAALTLVPEGWSWRISDRTPRAWVWPNGSWVDDNGNCPFGQKADAATPALALCIAALKARG